MENWLKVDFHCHTLYSKDSLARIQDLSRAARKAGLDRLVITDHNRIDGAQRACELDPELFIPGEEVLTDCGELLACFVTRQVPRGLPWRAAVDMLREQGAFISVSHPYDLYRHGWELEDLVELAGFVDAIEVFNARASSASINQMAAEFAHEGGLPGTAGSDAHSAREIGRTYLHLPAFSNADELRQVIPQAEVVGGLAPFSVHFSSMFARWVKEMGLQRSVLP